MDNDRMIERLKNVGITFEAGLSNEEFEKIESTFGFRFPSEIKSFFACGLPVGDLFFNWRDLSAENIEKFYSFYQSMDDMFLFDIENCIDLLNKFLGDRFSGIEDKEAFTKAVLEDFHHSTKLIPFYAHRCFFDGMNHMPIVSFLQAVDTIFYGESFEDYLEVEFLGKELWINTVPERMKETGIWYYLIS